MIKEIEFLNQEISNLLTQFCADNPGVAYIFCAAPERGDGTMFAMGDHDRMLEMISTCCARIVFEGFEQEKYNTALQILFNRIVKELSSLDTHEPQQVH